MSLRVVFDTNVLFSAIGSDDNRVLEAAVSGGATHIVTGDRRHLLPLRKFRDVTIVTPTQLLELMEREGS